MKALLVAVVFMLACGPSARETAIRSTFATANAARDGFLAYDAKHEMQIAQSAKDEVSGKAALAAYRAKRDEVNKAFAVIYDSISAALLIENDPKSLANMLAAAAQLKAAIDAAEKE